MKKIQTNNGEILVIEIPIDACNFKMHFSINYKLVFSSEIQDPLNVGGDMLVLPEINYRYKILGKLSDLTDEELEEIITANYGLSIKDSFKSLLKSNNIDWQENKTLILKIIE